MYTWHQKNQLGYDNPYVMFVNHDSIAFRKHWHEEIEVIYIRRGSALAEIGGVEHDITEGDIIFVGSRESHQYSSDDQEGASLIFDIGVAAFGDHRERMAKSAFRNPVLKRPLPDAAGDTGTYRDFVALFESILQAHGRQSAAYDLFLRARILDIAWMILDRLELVPVSHGQKARQCSHNERLNDVFRLVMECYDQDLDLGSVARQCNFSPRYFAKLFKESAGVSFCKYLSDFRVSQARTMLTETEHTVTEIAYRVGFKSMQTFERVFRSAVGISPSEYRRLRSGGQRAAP